MLHSARILLTDFNWKGLLVSCDIYCRLVQIHYQNILFEMHNSKVWETWDKNCWFYKRAKFHDPFTFKNLPPVKSVALSASQILKQRTIKLCRNEFQVSYSPFTLSHNHRPSTVSLRSLLSCAFLSGWYQLGLCF